MWELFADEYLPVTEMPWGRLKLRHVIVESDVEGSTEVRTVIRDNAHHAREFEGIGHGNGPIAAFCDALAAHHIDVRVLDYSEHAMSAGDDAPRPPHSWSARSAGGCCGESASTRRS